MTFALAAALEVAAAFASGPGASEPPAQAAATTPPSPAFVVRSDCGIDFVHRRFQTAGKKYLAEPTGSGVGLLDYDHDGDLDVYCVQCCPLPGYSGSETAQPDMLYRNEGNLHFVAVEPQSCGLGDLRYGMGVTCPDVDNDGWPDLFVTNVGRDALYRNNRDGTFTDVTEASGLVDDYWSTAAGWADLDGDGDLDLYLANYALIDFEHYRVCESHGRIHYCVPDALGRGAPDRLFRNDGSFRFTEVTREAGIFEEMQGGKGLAVLPFDVDGDGRIDLFVANDGDPNYLWVNLGGMKFEERAGLYGIAVNGRGVAQACMGSDLADVDGDLDLDLFAANFGRKGSLLFVREAPDFFTDRSFPSGLGGPSYLFTGFGARFLDYDRDGDADLLVVNGHVDDEIADVDPTQSCEQPPQLFQNRGDGTFTELGATLSPFFRDRSVGRGLATGDLDGDGDLDFVVLENDRPLVLVENRFASANHWIALALTGTRGARDAIGATVTLDCGGRKQLQLVEPTASYLSWNDPRLYFGVGSVDIATASAMIHWPSGTIQFVDSLALDRLHLITEPAH